MSPEIIGIISLCAFLVLWYGGGYLINRRRGRRFYQWLRPELDTLGRACTTTWLGSPSSSVRLTVTEPSPPFQHLEIMLLLENREIVLAWFLNRLRGRRDWLVLKATLAKVRPGEVEVNPAESRIAQGLRQQAEQPWKWLEGPHGLAIAHRGAGAQQQADRLAAWLSSYGDCLDRLSWRREAPHLQLQLRAAGLLERSSADLLTSLQAAIRGAVRS